MIDGEDTVSIYALCDPDPPYQVRYVGQTRMALGRRYYMHLSGPMTGRKFAWIESLRREGRRPVIRRLETVSREDADRREQFHIADQWERGAPLVNVMHVPGPPIGGGSPTHVRVQARDQLYNLLKDVADREQRSVSNLIGVLILEALRARGERLPEQATPPDYRQERGKQKGGDE